MSGKIHLYEIPEKGGYCTLKLTHDLDFTDMSEHV